MKKNILLVFICSIFLFPLVFVKAETNSFLPPDSPYLPNNNFNIIEYDQSTKQPKIKNAEKQAKETLDNVKKAKEQEEAVKKKAEEEKKLTFKNYEKKMSQLTSKVYFEKKFFGFDSNMNYFFNSIVQAIFWVGKIIFYVIAKLYETVEGMSDVSKILNETVKNSSKVFSTLLGKEFIYMIGISMASYLFYIFATGKGSFFKTLIKMLLIYALIGVYFIQLNVNGQNKYLLTHVYDSFRNTTITLNGEITKTLTGESKSGVETYFSETIVKGYKYMNSPLTDKGEFKLSEKEFQDLAGYNQGDGDYQVGDKKIKDIAKDKDPENKMLKGEWGDKFSYAFATDIDVVVVGIIYLLLGVSRFFFLIVFIFLIMLLPFILIISLFPKMDYLLVAFNKKAVSMLALSSMMLMATTVFSFFYNSLTQFIGKAVGNNLLVVVFFKSLLFYLMWKYRHSILSMFSRLTHSPVGSMTTALSKSQATQNLKNRLNRGVSTSGQLARGGMKLGRNKLNNGLKSYLDQRGKEQEERGRNRNGLSTMKLGAKGAYHAVAEQGNKAVEFLYKMRQAGVRSEDVAEERRLNALHERRKEKKSYHSGKKEASFDEMNRLREERQSKKQASTKKESQVKSTHKYNRPRDKFLREWLEKNNNVEEKIDLKPKNKGHE